MKDVISIFLPDQIHSRIPYNEGQKKAAGCSKSITCYPLTVSHPFPLLSLILYSDKTHSLESKLPNHSFSISSMTASKLPSSRFGAAFMRSHSLNVSVVYINGLSVEPSVEAALRQSNTVVGFARYVELCTTFMLD